MAMSDQNKNYQYKSLMRMAPKLVNAKPEVIKKWITAFLKLLKTI